ncbi:iron ABC transporter permease [Marinomonas sp. TW1]|nr:iron ABC transporter permease [Marinomonas sp. TW1]
MSWLLASMFVWHLALGATSLPMAAVYDALFHFDSSNFNHLIVKSIRLPRALVAVLVGASLSVAGALMQGVTRNPLAEPGILGLMAGASFAVVCAMTIFPSVATEFLPWIAALGALVTAIGVWFIAQSVPGGATPLALTLTGAAITAFLGTLISVMYLLSQDTFEQLRVWLTGSLAGRRLDDVTIALPAILAMLAFAMSLSRNVTVLAMGDSMAKGIGANTAWLKGQVLMCVVILTACSVSLAGPLGFVGLVVPHTVRLFVGADYRWVVPYSALFGAIYLLGVDAIARVLIRPEEISTGIITALVGGPLFIYLVRKRAH